MIGLSEKEVIQTELASLIKCELVKTIVQTSKGVKPIEYKWVLIQKHNENDKAIKYKARLIAQVFSQRLDIDYNDYNEKYSPIVCELHFNF